MCYWVFHVVSLSYQMHINILFQTKECNQHFEITLTSHSYLLNPNNLNCLEQNLCETKVGIKNAVACFNVKYIGFRVICVILRHVDL